MVLAQLEKRADSLPGFAVTLKIKFIFFALTSLVTECKLSIESGGVARLFFFNTFVGGQIMGLVKFGAGIIQISGAIAGTVHARNRFGNYIRPRTKPVNPHSTRQEAARAVVSYLAEYWHADLTAVQRGLWDVYAAAVAMKNRLGETIHLTGFNHFIRTNAARLMFGVAPWDAAPTILSLAEKDPTLICSEEDIAGQTFTFTCDDAGWRPDTDGKLAILLYQGQPQLASRNFFAGPWRYMDVIDDTEGKAGTGTYAAVFPFALGQKVWFQARVMTESGRVSELWTLDPRTIVADV